MFRVMKGFLIYYLIFALIIIGIAQNVFAGFSPSEMVYNNGNVRLTDLEKIQRVLEIKLVEERLKELGFTKNEIQKRLAKLSNEQIHQLATSLDELQVGGDAGWVIVFLLIAILVTLILYLSGYRIIVKRE